MKIVVVSGGFDPIHEGHLNYFKAAKKLGDFLIVALNSDDWLTAKKGSYFTNFKTRSSIISNLCMVDEVIAFKDDIEGSCRNALIDIKNKYRNAEIIFCNGGDRVKENIPEMSVDGIKFEFGVGGSDKINSSSWILKEWKYQSEERLWGKFYNLFEDKNVKVKELIVAPHSGMSYQRHFQRSEIWLLSKGCCEVKFSLDDSINHEIFKLKKHDHFIVPVSSWHQIYNPYDQECKIIEIQYGNKTIEDDIERLEYYSE